MWTLRDLLRVEKFTVRNAGCRLRVTRLTSCSISGDQGFVQISYLSGNEDTGHLRLSQ